MTNFLQKQTENLVLRPEVPISAHSDSNIDNYETQYYNLKNREILPQRKDYLIEKNSDCDNEMHLSSNISNDVSFLCAPHQDSDGGSDDENSGRIDKIFGGWLLKRIRENKDLVPIIKTVYQWNITKNGKIISVWSKFS